MTHELISIIYNKIGCDSEQLVKLFFPEAGLTQHFSGDECFEAGVDLGGDYGIQFPVKWQPKIAWDAACNVLFPFHEGLDTEDINYRFEVSKKWPFYGCEFMHNFKPTLDQWLNFVKLVVANSDDFSTWKEYREKYPNVPPKPLSELIEIIYSTLKISGWLPSSAMKKP
jgi:hypothetical protein